MAFITRCVLLVTLFAGFFIDWKRTRVLEHQIDAQNDVIRKQDAVMQEQDKTLRELRDLCQDRAQRNNGRAN